MINKAFLFTICFLSCLPSLLCQPGGFFRIYGGEESDQATALTLTSSNGYAFVGRTSSFGEGFLNIWFVKTDNHGLVLSQKAFGGDYADAGNAIEETLDGGFIFGGAIGEQDFFGDGIADGYIIKTDSSGDSIWTFTWEVDSKRRAIVTSLQERSDSTYIIAGTTDAEINGGPSKSFLLSLDKNGNELWRKIYEDYTYTTTFALIDDGYCFGGAFGVLGGGFTAPHLTKTNENGDTIWTKSGLELGISSGLVTSVLQQDDGSYFILGIAQFSSENAFVSKLDPSGNLIWSRLYGNSMRDHAYKIMENNQGGVIFTGTTAYNTLGEFDGGDIWLVNLDNDGEVLWSQTYGTEDEDRALDLEKCPDGGFIIAGYTIAPTNAFLLKTDSLGNVDSLTSLFNPDITNTQDISSFPNPVSQTLFVHLPQEINTADQQLTYMITDSQGKTIRQSAIANNNYLSPLAIDVKGLNSGVYYIVFSNGENRYWNKFVKP